MTFPHRFGPLSTPVPLSYLDDNFDALEEQSGSGNVGFIQAGAGAVARSAQDKMRDVVSVLDFMTEAQIADVRGSGSTSVLSAVQAALDSIDTSGGKGGKVVGPAGVYNFGNGASGLNIPARVIFELAGRRASIVNYSGSGAAITVDGVSLSQLKGARISLVGATGTAIGIDLKTTSASMLQCMFSDLEIVSNNTAGQIGIKATISGSEIISENTFKDVVVAQMAKPIVCSGLEGNFWYGIVIANFGTGASPVGVNFTGCHAEKGDFRVAGIDASVSGTPVAFQTDGDHNCISVSADIGGTGKALNSTHANGLNIFTVFDAEELTPVGTYGLHDLVINAKQSSFTRIRCGGTALVAGDFTLSAEWGSTATVTAVTATDQRGVFTINSSGIGQAANATVDINAKDGLWTTAPFAVISRAGGNQPNLNLWPFVRNTNAITAVCNGTPVAGESYAFSYIIMG